MTFFLNITTANFKDKVKNVTRKKITFIDLFETAIFKSKIFHLKLHGLWCKIKNMTITRLRFERPRLEMFINPLKLCATNAVGYCGALSTSLEIIFYYSYVLVSEGVSLVTCTGLHLFNYELFRVESFP